MKGRAVPHPNDLIDTRAQAHLLGITYSTLKTYASRYRDTFPRVHRTSGRSVYRSRSEIESWRLNNRPGGGNGRPRKDTP